jgi:aspartate dehydrogenase
MRHTSPGQEPRIAVIGAGAMARALVAGLGHREDGPRIGAVLTRKPLSSSAFDGTSAFHDADTLGRWQPDLIVECAGHGAVRDVLPGFLARGVDVIIASVGALMDRSLREELREAASRGDARIILPAGAVGGLDALRAAASAGLTAVRYTGRKPPLAWKGTPAEAEVDLDALASPAIIFEGSAAEAAALYPRNANVAATIALAALGPDRTRVTLKADPTISDNLHEIEAIGAFGRLSFQVVNRPMPDNPRTSLLAALSVQRAVLDHFSAIDFPMTNRPTP